MRIYRCPRCRAEDISADAHPARILNNGVLAPVLVCRSCYRPAELELRIAAETAGVELDPLSIREALGLLSDFYLDRLADAEDPDLLVEDEERAQAKARIQEALDSVRRRLAIEPVSDAG